MQNPVYEECCMMFSQCQFIMYECSQIMQFTPLCGWGSVAYPLNDTSPITLTLLSVLNANYTSLCGHYSKLDELEDSSLIDLMVILTHYINQSKHLLDISSTLSILLNFEILTEEQNIKLTSQINNCLFNDIDKAFD